jgi:hypothetical protein
MSHGGFADIEFFSLFFFSFFLDNHVEPTKIKSCPQIVFLFQL